MEAPKPKLVCDTVKSLLASGEYADFTISCQSEQYLVHKNIVCSRSKFFERAVQFGGTETHENRMTIDEEDPRTIKRMIQYLYEDEYEPKLSTMIQKTNLGVELPHTCKIKLRSGTPCDAVVCTHHRCGIDCYNACKDFICFECNADISWKQPHQLMLHSQMYTRADMYDVEGLKDLAKKKFRLACSVFWDDYLFPIAATHVFESTPDNDKGLRDIVTQTLCNHLELIRKPEVEVVLRKFHPIAVDILKKTYNDGWIF